MADRYWVGGTGTWDATSTANWSETSGGAGGASAPTSLDDVYFDSGSDIGANFTVTVGTDAVNKNVTTSDLDQIMTIAGSATWSCHGNIDIQSDAFVVNSHTGSMNLNGTTGVTNTIFTGGIPLVPNNGLDKRLNINGGRWLMTSALTLNSESFNGGLRLNSGIFDTQGYSLSVSNIYITGSTAKELYFRNSTIITRRDGFINNSTNGTLLFDAGTSTIDIAASVSGTSTDTLTFFNVNVRGYDGRTIIGPQLTIFNNLQCFTNNYTKPLQLSGNVIVNNTLSIVGRLNLISSAQGARRNVTADVVTFPNNVPINFRDINLSGSASPISGPNLGDAGNNQGINFPASKTIYLVSSQIISASTLRWSLTSGGTATEYLLPQDIGIIDNSSPASINWPVNEAYIAGTLDFTNRTNAITLTLFNSATTPSVFYIAFNGDLKLSSAVTLVTPTGTGLSSDLQFTGHKNQSLIIAGQQLNSVIVNKFNSALSLNSNLSIASNRTLFILDGTLNTNNYNISTGAVSSSTSNIRAINLGTSSITLTNTGTVWDTATTTNLSLSAANSSIILKSAGNQTFAGGGANYSGVTLVHGGAGNLTITGNNTFSSIRNTISQTAGSSIIFTSGSTTTITGKTELSGTSSAPLYLASSSTGTYTINNSGTSIQQADYLSVNNSIVTPSDNWYAGTRSIVTNSTGWSSTFSSAADLFWVGGDGTWDSSTNTKWAVISGGTGGTIAPTSTNNITFDSNSDTGSAFTVTVGTGAVCKTFSANSENSLDQAMTLAGTASCSINENLILPPINFTRTYTGTINFVGTLPKLINTNGVSFDNTFVFTGAATYDFQSSFTNPSSKDIYFNAGIINTNDFNISSGRFFLTSSNLQQVNLGSSTITVSSGILTGWEISSNATNLVLNSGTSLLRFSYTYGSLLDNRSSNKIYNNIEFIDSSHNIISEITCNNLTMANAASFIRLRGNLTVNGTLTILASTSGRCVNFYSDALDSTVAANAVNFSRVFFKDITAAGASAPWTGQLGDMGNNNNIQFPAPKTVYWRSTLGGGVYSNSWGFTPTGAIDVNAIPLPQDTGIILDNFPNSGQSIFLGWRNMNCGLDFSQRTQSVILTTNQYGSYLMGDLTLSPSVSFGSNLQSNSLEFCPNLKNIQFNSAGQTITFHISIRSGMNFENSLLRTPSINYGLNISGPLNSTKSISVLAGTLNSNNFEMSCTNFSSSGSLTRAINLGSSKINVSGNWDLATATNLTFSGSGTVNMTSSSAKTFAGGGANYSNVILNQGGSGELTLTGNNRFDGISNTIRPASIKFTAGSTTTLGKFMLNGGEGSPVTVSSTTTGTRYTLTSPAGVHAPYYASIRDANAAGGATWRAPTNYGNIDAGNNLGWDFSNVNTLTDNFMVLFPSNLHLTS